MGNYRGPRATSGPLSIFIWPVLYRIYNCVVSRCCRVVFANTDTVRRTIKNLMKLYFYVSLLNTKCLNSNGFYNFIFKASLLRPNLCTLIVYNDSFTSDTRIIIIDD